MTLIERLREAYEVCDEDYELYKEAADEIERLQHDLTRQIAITTEQQEEIEALKPPSS
jgi:hypothetical protein